MQRAYTLMQHRLRLLMQRACALMQRAFALMQHRLRLLMENEAHVIVC